MTILKKLIRRLRNETPLWAKIHEKGNSEIGDYIKQVTTKSNESDQLAKIFSGVEKFPMVEVYVHGSWADETLTPFSDLDDLVIIDRIALQNNQAHTKSLIRWLNKVECKFYRLDPLQHHGHWVIFKDELQNSNQSYLPIKVLENAICIQGRRELRYSIDNTRTSSGLLRNIQLTIYDIKLLFKKYQNGVITTYEMKALVGSFLILPAYCFQRRGFDFSKRKAIESASILFTAESCDFLMKCSAIRTEWGRALIQSNWRYKFMKLLTYIMFDPFLYPNIAKWFSPLFPAANFPVLEESEVENFIIEVKRYADYK
jgi:hypothetical protein